MVLPRSCASQAILVSWDRPASNRPQFFVESQQSTIPGQVSLEKLIWCAGYIANRSECLSYPRTPDSITELELVARLYELHGVQAAERIAGPLAWILWDETRRKLVAIRDRVGIYCIYYALHGGKLWLSNQVELLLKAGAVLPSINPRAVVAHLQGLPPALGETFYEDVHALEPGYWLEITEDKLNSGRYWRIEAGPVLKLASDEEYASDLRDLLFRVVASHIPPGPAGVTLSSGLDSTSVSAAFKATHPSQELVAFSWVTPELVEADESRYTDEVCQYLNLPSAQIRADLAYPFSTPRGIQTTLASPFYNYYTELWDEVFQAVRQHGISTLFTGLSGDNLFGGNVFIYPDLLITGRWLELARQMGEHLPKSPWGKNRFNFFRKTTIRPVLDVYLPVWRRIRARHVPWLGEKYKDLHKVVLIFPQNTPRMLPSRRQRLDLLCDPVLSQISEYVTWQAAGHSIEMRHPLLDHRLLEYAASLPTSQTFRAGQRKIILRNAMRGYLPDSVLDMWGKIYPSAIFKRGVRERETEKVWNLMTGMRAAELGYVDQAILRQNYQEYLDGKHEDERFWHAITLEDWLRRYF